MTLVSAPLYVFFGWLSDRVGRKPVMVGGMLLALVLYFPGFHLIAQAANPALVAAQRAHARYRSRPTRRPARSSSTRSAPPNSRAPATSPRARSQPKASPTRRKYSPDGRTRVFVGREIVAVERRRWTGRARIEGAQGRDRRTHRRGAAGGTAIPRPPTRLQANMPLLIAVLLLFVVAATALYGPQASALVEMFPTRIRYTAMSLPYHLGTGWVGGFLPVTSFALVAITGNIYAGSVVPGVLHRPVGGLRPAVPQGNPRQAARGLSRNSRRTSGCRSAARLRPAPGRSAA